MTVDQLKAAAISLSECGSPYMTLSTLFAATIVTVAYTQTSSTVAHSQPHFGRLDFESRAIGFLHSIPLNVCIQPATDNQNAGVNLKCIRTRKQHKKCKFRVTSGQVSSRVKLKFGDVTA